MPNEKLTTDSYCETCRNMTLAIYANGLPPDAGVTIRRARIYAPRDMLTYDFADTAVFPQRLPLSFVTVLK
jgi:hypothetical protein